MADIEELMKLAEAWAFAKTIGDEVAARSNFQTALTEALGDGCDDVREWIIVNRPGLVPDRKGPMADAKHTERMLRELYEVYPDCVCTVVQMPNSSYPESGREWLSINGDRRRKPPLPPKAEQ